jgi:iron donor protein CyaY
MQRKTDFENDTAFRLAINQLLEDLLDRIDNLEDDDLDPRLTAGNLSVTFEDESVILLSQQTPTHELWLSANYTAWHFLHKEDSWVERDTGEPLHDVLAKLFSEKLGETVSFSS